MPSNCPRTPTKQKIKPWDITVSMNGYLLQYQIQERRRETKEELLVKQIPYKIAEKWHIYFSNSFL
jgi:hypothetical protein